MAVLKRSLSFWDAVLLGIGAMVGGGIFAVIAVASGVVSSVWALLLAFLIAGVLAAFNALSMAELAYNIPKTGASYEYARKLLSREAGFAAGALFVSSKTLEAATVAVALGAYAAPALGLGNFSIPIAISAIALLTFVNLQGVRASAVANHAMVAAKLGVLALFVFFGLGALNPQNLEFKGAESLGGALEAAAILFFAYTGYARITVLAGEIKNPKEYIPRAIAFALGITAIIYLLVAFVAGGVSGTSALSQSQNPIALASQAIAGNWLVLLVSFAAVVATASVSLGDLLAVSRTVFAMAQNSDLPKMLGAAQGGNPKIAVLASGISAAILAASVDFKSLASLTSLSILAYYAIGNASALSLGKKRLYPQIFSWLGLLGCGVLAIFIPFEYWVLQATVLAIAFAYYYLFAINAGAKAAPRH